MDAQMSNYPPPPNPDQQHYNPIYPTSAGAQQLLDPVQQEQLNFNALSQPSPYPKLETESLDPSAANQIEQRIEQLRQQPLPPHQPQQEPLGQQHHLQPQHQHEQAQGDTPSKVNRLRKACDSCSIRKVKCDESGPPCRACSSLDIPCTFERPSRRRGPPNRHAEAIKRRRLESPLTSGQSAPSSPTHAAQALAALSSHTAAQPPLSAESICPIDMLDLLINDYFTYIHPLTPFPHEPSFREAWRRREDYNNRPFLALLASMIAALVASFPRKPRLHLKAQRRENLFPNHMALVDKCQKICAAARGPGYLESDSLSVHDAATSYLLGLTGCYTFRWRQARLYFSECLTIIRALGLHKSKEHTYTHLGELPAVYGSHGVNHEGSKDDMIDNITLEMGRRIFWTMFVSARSIAQLGTSFSELFIAPETPSDPYPPLPTEVDDFCIFPTHIDQQPPGLLPIMAGFNANVRVYTSCNTISVMEVAWGIDHVVDWERQKRVMHESLRMCKNSISSLPGELTVWPNQPLDLNSHNHTNGHDLFSALNPSFGQRDPTLINLSEMEPSPEERRRMQYEIQKANIYASSLCTRSYIVEKYYNILEIHAKQKAQQNVSGPGSPDVLSLRLDGMLAQAQTGTYDGTEDEMAHERENIVKDLLVVLSTIDKVNMEPNADSFTHKIRSVASTLIDVPRERKGAVAQQAEMYLKAFLNILLKLERVSPTHNNSEHPEDEDAELRHWADLREYQMKFAQQGGILGLG